MRGGGAARASDTKEHKEREESNNEVLDNP